MLLRWVVLVLSLHVVWLAPAVAETKEDPNRYEDDEIVVRVIPREKENIIAFYQGRGFPERAYPEINNVCYVTFLIRNKSRSILWLELDNWQFMSSDKSFRRLDRTYWKQVWQKHKLSRAHQSTFGWSLLPEQRDLHPDEPVGGSTTMTFTRDDIAVELRFKRGSQRDQGEKRIRFNNIQCKE